MSEEGSAVDPQSDEESDRGPVLSVATAERAARTRKRGLLRRAVLFAAGANKGVLKFVPTEETGFSVIGTFVYISTALAAFGSFTLAGYFFEGRIVATKATLIAAGAWALLIFVMDRAIVRTPINQVRFSSDTLEMLSGPEMDAVFQDIAMGARAHGVKWSPFSFLSVVVSMIPRLLIAFLASYLVAEACLIAIYSKDIQPIVQARTNQITQEVLQSDATLRSSKVTDIDKQIQQATTSLAPNLARKQSDLEDLQTKEAGFENDVGLIAQALAAECNSVRVKYTLSTGLPVETTGKPGCGPNAPGRLRDLQTTYETKVVTANRDIDTLQRQVDSMQERVDSDPLVIQLRAERASLANGGSDGDCTPSKPSSTSPSASPLPSTTKGKKRKASASTTESSDCVAQTYIRGIGIREEALRDLEHDTDPATVAVDPAPACKHWICKVGRFFVYPSPAGRKVAAIRWILFLMEIMAVLVKMGLVLRRRRPYDTFLAALEVVHEGSSVAMAGNELANMGAVLEQKSAYRRLRRVAAVADVLLHRYRRRESVREWWKPWRGSAFWRLVGRTSAITDDEAFPEPPHGRPNGRGER